nr:helix-turn-helix domain-containing protein [Sedimentibacter sp.]
MFIKDILAQRLKQLRKENKLKQEDLGSLINVSKTQISDIENGKKSTSIENLVVLAEYFNVSIDYLLGKSDNSSATIDKNNDIHNLTENEMELLKDFRILDKYEQNVIIGKISEMIYNKNVEESNLEVECSEELINMELRDRLNK